MPAERPVRTSLEVGFPGEGPPEEFLRYRGAAMRSIPASLQFPYEDAQFEVVMMDGSAVSRETVKEAHRVLKPEGRLFFMVPEKTRKQPGYTMPDIYAVVREGFNIVQAQRPPWWLFGRRGRTLTICARKKNWKSYKAFLNEGTVPLSPFWNKS